MPGSVGGVRSAMSGSYPDFPDARSAGTHSILRLVLMQERAVIFLQWPASLAILIWVPGNLGKLFALLLLWAVTFARLSRSEWVFGLAACLFFSAMNVASLRSGIFMFSAPDVLGMPAYE